MIRKALYKIIFSLLCVLLSTPSYAAALLSSVQSPNGRIKVELLSSDDNSISYRVIYSGQEIITQSRLGLRFQAADFTTNLTLDSLVENVIDEEYTLPSGKVGVYRNHCNQMTAIFKRIGNKIGISFRVFDDGIAFRYTMPDLSNGILESKLREEITEINLLDFQNSWAQPYRLDYSYYYDSRKWEQCVEQKKFCAPVLVQSANIWTLLTEAANYGTTATSMLIANEKEGSFSFNTELQENLAFPLEMPWRTIIVGDLQTIMKSTMVENLNPATDFTDVSWIVPGRSSWDWGGEDANNAIGYDIATRYIDFANEMGWEYFTLDDGWDRGDYQLSQVLDYAKSKDVKVILWSHQNRFTSDKDQIRTILKEWKDLGVAGVKVDFWESDNLSMMKKYDAFLEVAGEQKLVVNLHGCTKPSGTRRKWPHLLTTEAVFGGEMYLFNSESTTAIHNINLTMTRNVIGSMDYTPCDFGSKSGRVKQSTSWAHQLALLTAYESGIQTYVDRPENYRYHIAQSLMERLPASWDEIIPIEALPDSFVTIARRSGDDWYVSSLCNNPRILNLDLSFLDDGKRYCAYIYKDGSVMSEIVFDYIKGLQSSDKLSILLQKSGGATIHLSTSADNPKPKVHMYEAESEKNSYPKLEADASGLCSGGKYVSYVGNGNSLIFNDVKVNNSGTYAMTIYYMAGEDRSADIKVNGQEVLTHKFHSSSGWGGDNLSFTTLLIPLNEGSNTIEFANNSGYSPNFDRITIKSLNDDSTDPFSHIKSNQADVPHIYSLKNEVYIISSERAVCNVFTLNGILVKQVEIREGENRIRIRNGKGPYIISIKTKNQSYSTKQLLD